MEKQVFIYNLGNPGVLGYTKLDPSLILVKKGLGSLDFMGTHILNGLVCCPYFELDHSGLGSP